MKLTRGLIGILFLSFSLPVMAQDKLIFAIDIIRHGDRNPAIEFSGGSVEWPGGLGELTPAGMLQEYQLGATLRKKYVDEYHLLPKLYQFDMMTVRSTNVNRTLMSAESFLYGLYPVNFGATPLPFGYQPIPIHTVKKEDEDLLIPDQNRTRMAILLARYVWFTHAWRAKNAELKSFYPRWSALTGVSIHNLLNVLEVGDNLYIRQLRHKPFPKGMSAAEGQQIITAAEWAFLYLFSQRPVGLSTMHNLLVQITTSFHTAVAGQSPLKYILYSGHDSTITAVLSALGAPVSTIPGYASDLNFSLFKNDRNEPYIVTSLNGQVISLPGCAEGRCSLAQFEQLTR